MLTAAEVGELFGLSPKRVWDQANHGRLPVVRLGRRMFFPRHGIEIMQRAAIERALTGPGAK